MKNVEWHFDEMFPRIGFIVTKMTGCSRKVVKLLRGRWLGLLLLADFAIVCSIKSAYDSGSEIWWMSHVGLLIAGLGFVGRSSMLISTALISIFVLHSLWLVDCLVWLVTDQFVLGVTTYLQDARLGVWVATAHHFYLVPLLLISVLDSRRCPRASFPAAVALFIFLSLISRAFLAPADNVNFAFRVDTSLDWTFLYWINHLPPYTYLFALNAFVSAGFFLPSYIGLRFWCTRRNRPVQKR